MYTWDDGCCCPVHVIAAALRTAQRTMRPSTAGGLARSTARDETVNRRRAGAQQSKEPSSASPGDKADVTSSRKTGWPGAPARGPADRPAATRGGSSETATLPYGDTFYFMI
jgi:hypothetical protein